MKVTWTSTLSGVVTWKVINHSRTRLYKKSLENHKSLFLTKSGTASRNQQISSQQNLFSSHENLSLTMSDPTHNNTGAPTLPPAAPPAMLTQTETTGLLTQESATVFQTPQPTNGAPTIIQVTPNKFGKRNLFPTDGSPAIEVKPLSKRKKKFNVKTPQKSRPPTLFVLSSFFRLEPTIHLPDSS